MNVRFRERLERGDLLLGTFLTLPSPEVAEVLAEAGFDWMFVDMEHSPFSLREVQRIFQAVEDRCPCVVRVPDKSETWVKRVLDLNPEGIVVPHIESAEETEKVLGWALYPPEGTRSAGIARAQGYGLTLRDYVRKANSNTLVIPQVEHREAVDNIESIVRIEGLKAVFVGPYDLSGSLGKLGDVQDAGVQSMVANVFRASREAGLRAGIFGVNVAGVQPYIQLGYTLVAVGTDTLWLGKAAQEALKTLRAKID